MKMMRKFILIVVAGYCFNVNALALDASDVVKVAPLLKTATSWDGQPIVYPQGKAEVTAMQVEIAPGAETGWHTHSVPSFALMLEGSLEVRLKDGRVKRLEAGEALAEVVNRLHTGRNVGIVPVKLIVFYMGIEGQAHTVSWRQSQPQIPPVAVGADRDQHGCIGSAGYAWCAREKACVRPWVLAGKKGFESNTKAFERYCSVVSK